MEPCDDALQTADESAPLLTAQRRSSTPDSPHRGAAGDPASTKEPRSPFYPHALFFIFALSFVADLGGSLVDTPEVRLLEMALCRDYYLEHDPSRIGPPPLSYINEELCKVDEIQVDLAYIRAVKSLLMTVPGLLLTIPYGRLADKVGRRPIALLGMLGQVLAYFWVILVCYFHQTFPTRLVLLSPAFLAVGGGSRVLSAIMAAVIADVSPESMRTTVFYIVGAGLLVTEVVAAPIGSWLLSKDLWLPFKFSAPIILLSFPVILAMPETLPPRKISNTSDDGQANRHEPLVQLNSTLSQRLALLARRVLSDLGDTARGLNPFTVRKEMTICLGIIFLSAFTGMAGGLFIQYTSKLLGWSIATSGYILGVQSLVTLCTLVALAGITQVLEHKTGTRPLSLDVWVIRSSLVLLAAGAIFVAASKEPVLLILGSMLSSAGSGITQALQGFLATFADKSSTGQLFAGAALIDLLARLTGSLAFAKLFDVGLGAGSRWGIGLPFYVCGALTSIAAGLAFLLPTAQ